MLIRAIIFSLILVSTLSIIGRIFWEQEYKYTLPTPAPKNLKEVNIGDKVVLPNFSDNKTIYIHFYNYDCPCSRFNISEFKNLVYQYKDSVNFIAVLETSGLKKSEIESFKAKYDLGIQVFEDSDGSIASSLGVYSTPQAVVVKDDKIFYKGNYNKARFCLTKNTRFAEQALEAAIYNQPLPDFPEVAIIPYGCELPANSKSTSSFSFLNLSL